MKLKDDERVWLNKLLQSQKQAQEQELKTLPKADGSDSAATARLKDHLEATGRTGATDTPTARKTRADKKEAHLEDVLQRDEEGENIRRLNEREGRTLDYGTKELAKRGDVAAQQEAIEQLLKREEVETRINARIKAQLLASPNVLIRKDLDKLTDADWTTHADDIHKAIAKGVEDVAVSTGMVMPNGDAWLAHFASRHGPKTTREDQVTRIATGVPADKKVANAHAAYGSENVTLATGENVSVAKYPNVGKDGKATSSRFNSAESALYLAEESMAQVNAQKAEGVTGDIKAVIQTSDTVGFGESYTNYGTGAPNLPGSGAALPTNTLRQRAQNVSEIKNVQKATVIMGETPDGGVQPVSTYPDSTPTAVPGIKVNNVTQNLATNAAAKRNRDLNKATAEVTASEALVGSVSTDPETKKAQIKAKQVALDQKINAVPAAKAELEKLAKSVAKHKAAEAAYNALNSAQQAVTNAKNAMTAAQVTRNTEKGIYEGAKTPQNEGYLKAAEKDLLVKMKALQAAEAQLKEVKQVLPSDDLTILNNAKLAATGDVFADNMAAKAKVPGNPAAKDLAVNQVKGAANDLHTTQLANGGQAQLTLNNKEQAAAEKKANLDQKINAVPAAKAELEDLAKAVVNKKNAEATLATFTKNEAALTKVTTITLPAAEQALLLKEQAHTLAEQAHTAAPNPATKLALKAAYLELEKAKTKVAVEKKKKQDLQALVDDGNTKLAKTAAEQELLATQQAEVLARQAATAKCANSTGPGDAVVQAATEHRLAARNLETAQGKAKAAQAEADRRVEIQAATKLRNRIESSNFDTVLAADVNADKQAATQALRNALQPQGSDTVGMARARFDAVAQKQKQEIATFETLVEDEIKTRNATFKKHSDAADTKLQEAKKAKEAADKAEKDLEDVKKAPALREAELKDFQEKETKAKEQLDALKKTKEEQEKTKKDVDGQAKEARERLELVRKGPGPVVAEQLAAAKKLDESAGELAKQAEQAEATAKDAKEKNSKAKERLGKLEPELKQAKEEAAALEQKPSADVQKQVERATQLGSQAEDLKKQAATLEQQAKEAKQQAATATSQLEQLQKQIEEANTKRSESTAAGKKITTEVNQLGQQRRQAETQAQALAEQLDVAIKTGQPKEAQEALTKQIMAKQAEANRIAAQFKVRQTEVDRLRQEAADAEKLAQEAGSKVEGLRGQIEQAEAKAKESTEKIEPLKADAERVVQEQRKVEVEAKAAHEQELEQARQTAARLEKETQEASKNAQATAKLEEESTQNATQTRQQATTKKEEAGRAQQEAKQAQEQELKTAEDTNQQAEANVIEADKKLKETSEGIATQEKQVAEAGVKSQEADKLKKETDSQLATKTQEAEKKVKESKAEAAKQEREAAEAERVRQSVKSETEDQEKLDRANLARANAEHNQRVKQALKNNAKVRSVAEAAQADAELVEANARAALLLAEKQLHAAQHKQEAAQVAYDLAEKLHQLGEARAIALKQRVTTGGAPLTEQEKTLIAQVPKLLVSKQKAQARLQKHKTDPTTGLGVDDITKKIDVDAGGGKSLKTLLQEATADLLAKTQAVSLLPP